MPPQAATLTEDDLAKKYSTAESGMSAAGALSEEELAKKYAAPESSRKTDPNEAFSKVTSIGPDTRSRLQKVGDTVRQWWNDPKGSKSPHEFATGLGEEAMLLGSAAMPETAVTRLGRAGLALAHRGGGAIAGAGGAGWLGSEAGLSGTPLTLTRIAGGVAGAMAPELIKRLPLSRSALLTRVLSGAESEAGGAEAAAGSRLRPISPAPAPAAPEPNRIIMPEHYPGPRLNPADVAEAAPTAGSRLQPIGEAPTARSPRGYFNPGRGEPVRLEPIVNEAMGVKPLKADVPLREQLTKTTAIEPAEIDPIKAKYPDPQVRQMVRANGEQLYEAAKHDPNLVAKLHDLTRVDLRQALINSGEDMGQTTVSNSKFAGQGSISREEAFNRLLAKGHKPDDILSLAKQTPVAAAGNQTTEQQFFNAKTGEWAPERQAIHEMVINDALAGKTPPIGRAPEATITIGGTGAGKTTLTRHVLGENPNMVNVDADLNKLHIPEFEGLKKSDPVNAAFRVHEESSHIAKRTVAAAVQKGLDFVYDTSTGGSGPALFAKLKEAGYKVRVLYADVATDTAVERSMLRAQMSTDPTNRGRFVPESVIREKHQTAAKAFNALRSSPHVDELHGYDTTSRAPQRFYERVGSRETIHDQGRLDAVQRKTAGSIEDNREEREPALTH
jgi:predicted ABC-type ATPase